MAEKQAGRKSMSKANARQSSHKKEYYRKQRLRTTVNKKKAWKKHLEMHPNDIFGKEAIEKKRHALILG